MVERRLSAAQGHGRKRAARKDCQNSETNSGCDASESYEHRRLAQNGAREANACEETLKWVANEQSATPKFPEPNSSELQSLSDRDERFRARGRRLDDAEPNTAAQLSVASFVLGFDASAGRLERRSLADWPSPQDDAVQ